MFGSIPSKVCIFDHDCHLWLLLAISGMGCISDNDFHIWRRHGNHQQVPWGFADQQLDPAELSKPKDTLCAVAQPMLDHQGTSRPEYSLQSTSCWPFSGFCLTAARSI